MCADVLIVLTCGFVWSSADSEWQVYILKCNQLKELQDHPKHSQNYIHLKKKKLKMSFQCNQRYVPEFWLIIKTVKPKLTQKGSGNSSKTLAFITINLKYQSVNCKPELQSLSSVWWFLQSMPSEASKFLSTCLDGDKFSTKIITQQPPESWAETS